LQRAAELQGGPAEVPSAVTQSLIRRRQFAEAVAVAEKGRRLDPLSYNAQMAVGATYRAAGEYNRAVQEFRQALAMSPGQPRARFQLGVTFVAMGRWDDAIRELEPAARPAHGHNARFEAHLGHAYAAAGRSEARATLAELEAHRRDQYVSWFGVAVIHDALGERAPALAALQRAYDDRAVEFGQMAQYPPFKAIAAEPAFQALMRQIGLPR
jgi:Flp pilus assembly protein TadD